MSLLQLDLVDLGDIVDRVDLDDDVNLVDLSDIVDLVGVAISVDLSVLGGFIVMAALFHLDALAHSVVLKLWTKLLWLLLLSLFAVSPAREAQQIGICFQFLPPSFDASGSHQTHHKHQMSCKHSGLRSDLSIKSVLSFENCSFVLFFLSTISIFHSFNFFLYACSSVARLVIAWLI